MDSGLLIIDKERDMTSRDVVNKVCHILHTKKVGHTGTLDPIATGVLVVTVGKYTKLNELLTSTYKEYIAEFKLGILTDTLDITGTTISTSDKKVTEIQIKEAIMHFLGTYSQEVPIYSSVKVNGRKLYEYARNNESVDLPSRNVDIKNIEIINIGETITMKCLVSKGTYIRSLIRDIGEYLETHATMTNLRRTKQGIFNIEESISLTDLDNNNFKLLKLQDVMSNIKKVELTDEQYFKVLNGVKQDKIENEEYILYTYKNEEIAIYKNDNEYLRMYCLLK